MYQFSVVNGKCCQDPEDHWIFFIPCAGCGPCNIFCCNCENGCNRKWHSYNGIPKWAFLNRKWYPSEKGMYNKVQAVTCGHWDKKRELVQNSKNASFEADELFRDIDTDDSRDISINETKQFFVNKMKLKRSVLFSFAHSSFEEKFLKMDENNDGLISPIEFDESLNN